MYLLLSGQFVMAFSDDVQIPFLFDQCIALQYLDIPLLFKII